MLRTEPCNELIERTLGKISLFQDKIESKYNIVIEFSVRSVDRMLYFTEHCNFCLLI